MQGIFLNVGASPQSEYWSDGPPWRDSFSIDVPCLSSRSGPGARRPRNNPVPLKTKPALARQKLGDATERKTRSGPGSTGVMGLRQVMCYVCSVPITHQI